MEDLGFSRTGDARLVFRGEVITTASSGTRDATRWHHLVLARTEGGQWVISIAYCSRWQGELGHQLAVVLPDADAVRGCLRAYDLAAHVTGYPPTPTYEDKQRRLLADLRRRYESAVSQLLADVPEMAERIQ